MKLPIYILIALLASSCGKIRKNLTVDRIKSDIQTEEKIVEEIVTTEKTDTLVIIPADTSEWILPLRELVDSSLLVVESDVQIITFKFDPEKKTVKAKAVIKEKKVPVLIDKKKTERRSIESENRSRINTFEKDRQVEKTKPLIPWYWIIILIVVAAGYFYFRAMPMNIFRN